FWTSQKSTLSLRGHDSRAKGDQSPALSTSPRHETRTLETMNFAVPGWIAQAARSRRVATSLSVALVGTFVGSVACSETEPVERPTERESASVGTSMMGCSSDWGGGPAEGAGGAMTEDPNPPLPGCPDTRRFNEANQRLVFCHEFLGSELDRRRWQTEG